MDVRYWMLGWTIVGLQTCGVWSLLVSRFAKGRRLLASAHAVFVLSLFGLAVCSATAGVRGWGSGVTAGATLAGLFLGISFDGPAKDHAEALSVVAAPQSAAVFD